MRLALLVLVAVLLPGVCPRAEPPPRMTTDSREYCAHLSGEMLKMRYQRGLTAAEASHLADEGRRLCERGHYKGGVARLRRALMLMRTAP